MVSTESTKIPTGSSNDDDEPASPRVRLGSTPEDPTNNHSNGHWMQPNTIDSEYISISPLDASKVTAAMNVGVVALPVNKEVEQDSRSDVTTNMTTSTAITATATSTTTNNNTDHTEGKASAGTARQESNVNITPTNSMEDQVEVLLRAIELAAKLASVDSTSLHQSLTSSPITTTLHELQNDVISTRQVSGVISSSDDDTKTSYQLSQRDTIASVDTTTTTATNNNNNITRTANTSDTDQQNTYQPLSTNDESIQSIQTQINTIQNKWKLEETFIPQLLSSIQRLHSNIYHLHTEADASMPQVQTLLQENINLLKQNDGMEQSLHKLQEDNQRLKQAYDRQKFKNKNIVRTMKEFVRNKRREEQCKEEEYMAREVNLHEGVLRLASPANRGDCSSSSMNSISMNSSSMNMNHGSSSTIGSSRSIDTTTSLISPIIYNRNRTSTADSNFSDLDPSYDKHFNYDYDTTTITSTTQREYDDRGGGIGIGATTTGGEDICDGASQMSSVSSNSNHSLITNEGVATLRLDSAKRKGGGGSERRSSRHPLYETTTTIVSGMRLEQTLSQDGNSPKTTNDTNEGNNRTRAFSDSATIPKVSSNRRSTIIQPLSLPLSSPSSSSSSTSQKRVVKNTSFKNIFQGRSFKFPTFGNTMNPIDEQEDTSATVVTPSDKIDKEKTVNNENISEVHKESSTTDRKKDDDDNVGHDDELPEASSYESTNELESGNSQSSDKENPKEEDVSSCSYVKVDCDRNAEDHKRSSPTVCDIPVKETTVPSKQSAPSQMSKKKKNPHEHIHALNLNFLNFH